MPSRRDFLKGLGALVLTALPACRRAQQFAIEPESCPEWQLPGEATCLATSMPWATGALPLLAVCHDGLPTMLQPNPHYSAVRRGLPAFAQATLLDLYNPARPDSPTFNNSPYPEQALQGAFRAWSTALKSGKRRIAFLFPAGYSPLRTAQVNELSRYSGTAFYEYDPLTAPRHSTCPELDELIASTLGPACRYPSGYRTLSDLTEDLPKLDILFIFTPADPAALEPNFAAALHNSPAETIRLCPLAPDHTARLCRYTIPLTHFLEEWGAEADSCGNLCLRQPVTHPLRPAVSEAELLHCLLHSSPLPLSERPDISPAREWLLRAVPTALQALRHGTIPAAAPQPTPQPPAPPVPLPHYLHPYFADGRFAHNLWLQETWFPLTGCAGAAEVLLPGTTSPCRAIVNGHPLPACGLPALHHPCLPLCPQTIGATTFTTAAEPLLPHQPAHPLPPHRTGSSPSHPSANTPQWALIIDPSRCNGCGACSLACRAENNIPTIGIEELANHRDLHWLPIRRFSSPAHPTATLYLPSPCRQCENAPCEAVCPVHATIHTDEGLNAMVYPRCWGTRYCATACPYQSRHFNFRDYARHAHSSTQTPHNPHVSLRPRGVMEKCTYCSQRINTARRNSDIPQTACQQACPNGAIRLVDLRHHPLTPIITSFDHPGTSPRTLYLDQLPLC